MIFENRQDVFVEIPLVFFSVPVFVPILSRRIQKEKRNLLSISKLRLFSCGGPRQTLKSDGPNLFNNSYLRKSSPNDKTKFLSIFRLSFQPSSRLQHILLKA